MTAAARAGVRKSGAPDGVGDAAPPAKGAPVMGPPDGGWGWMVVLGVAMVNLATRSLEPSFGLLFGSTLKELNVATTGAAIIVSTQDALINFSGLFAGPLIRRYSYRKVAFGGSLLVAIGILATVPASSVTHIIATYSVLIGLGVGFSSAATFVSLSHYFKARRGQAVGLSMAGTALGFMLAPLLVRYLMDELGFGGALLVLGGVALNGLAGAILLQPAKWHLVPVLAGPGQGAHADHDDGHLDLEEAAGGAAEEQDEPPTLREAALPLLARPRIELTLVEEDEEAYQLTIRAQNPERKTSTVSGGGLAFEVFTDPKRKFSVTAAPTDTSKASLEDSEPHLYPCRKLSQPAMPRNASVLSMEDHAPRRVTAGRHGLPRNTSVVSMSVADNAVTGERKLSRTHHCIPRNVSWISMGAEEVTGRKLSRAGLTRTVSSTRIRKASIISASSMDLTGSLMAIAAASQQDLHWSTQNNNTIIGSHENINHHDKDKSEENSISCWRRISNFLDLDLLKDSTYLNITLGLSLFWVAELHFKMVVPFFLADLGHTKKDTAFCLSMSALSDIIARLILPPICDRVKYKKRTLFFIACIFLTFSRSVMAEQTSWAPLIATLVVCGFCRGATLINYQLTVAECVTLDKLPAAVGLNMVAKGITVVSLGPLLGLVRDATGSYPIFIHAQSLVMALGLLAWIVEYLYRWWKGSSKRQSEH